MRPRRGFLITAGALVALIILLLAFGRPLAQRLLGVNLDTGAAGQATLQVPPGFRVNVFAQDLSGPRFMAVGPDGALYVADRGRNRVVALPDADHDGRA